LRLQEPALGIKYVDDTSILTATKDPSDTALQSAADTINNWSRDNNMKLNAKKTKELLVSFSKKEVHVPPITINDTVIERVSHAKVLGLFISADLTWNVHVDYILKKANKRMYMLIRCKRAGVSSQDLLKIYCAVIRPVLEYCCVVWHSSLPKYLHEAIEKVQKRTVYMICGKSKSYHQNLQDLAIESLYERRQKLCKQFFENMMHTDHKLNFLIPQTTRRRSECSAPAIETPRYRTNRYRDSFIPFAIMNFQ
jgi:hypothetical protein